MSDESRGLQLPIPKSLVLQDFSLYQNRQKIEVKFGNGVFCLAGANGLGKSTFLTTLNYAITGVAADPDRKFDSMSEYYRYTLPYARSYYSGRIAPIDHEVASVRVVMTVGERTYELERGFFGSGALSFLQIWRSGGIEVAHDESASDEQRSDTYKACVVADSGLADFEQLVFLQHFLATFDERRRLLLWDNETIEQALLLAFGVSPADAKRTDELRRKIEKADSQARNLQYQATTARNRKRDLLARVERASPTEVDDDYERHKRERASVSDRLDRVRDDLASTKLQDAQLQASLVQAERSYEEAFAALMRPRPGAHPVVVAAVQSGTCPLCATPDIRAQVETVLADHCCPLCRSAISDDHLEAEPDLDALDADLVRRREDAAATAALLRDLNDEEARLSEELALLDADGDEAPDDETVPLTASAVAALIAQFDKEAADATKRRDEFRARRDAFSKELAPVARELAQRYASAEEAFVPLFTELAHSFLGLEVEVYLQQRAGRPSLVVAVEGSERRSFDQLSESQRYFLDIALRMALIQHIAGPGLGGCLLVDTPEGSLDISYEARAGDMFANFVAAGNRLVMTANINTSQLLLQMATACGSERMQIVRMMEWTRLSDVQADGEALFDRAFADLSVALARGSREV